MTKARKKEVAKTSPKILIGVPILMWTHEFAISFMEFWTELMLSLDRKIQVGYEFKYRRPVHLAEEELAQLALDTGCTHLLLMDDDIYGMKPSDLYKLIDADKDVIGGIMHASAFPHAMCAFRRYDAKTKVADQPILKGSLRLYEIPPDQRKGIQKADLIPFAFTLIKTKVFKKLKKPWFIGHSKAPTDSWFADSVLDAKLQYYAHFDVWTNHRGVTRENRHLWFQMGLIEKQKSGKGVIQLTPEDMAKHELMMQTRMKEAEDKAKKLVVEEVKFRGKPKIKKA